ncbi:MAG: NAD(P)/FAD-dependent oxidoreductase [Chloroflexota bacterium]
MKEYDIIVIGAGMSGLAAASEIYKSNKNIIVLEARDRIGGRLSSETLPDGVLFERGGELIHGTVNPMYRLVKELGIKIREMKKEPTELSMIDTIQMLFVFMLLRIGIYPKPQIDENVLDYVNRLKFLPKSLHALLDHAGKDLETLDKISAMFIVDRIRQELLTGEMYSEHDFVIQDGYITLLNHLADELPIALSHEVRKVTWQKGQVVITTNQGTFRAPKVVLTLPIPILKKMDFEPALPKEKQVALSAHVAADIIKFLVPVQKKAFKTDQDQGQIADAKLVPIWWRRNTPCDKPDDRQMLVGWITGPYARHYLSQAPENALESTLSELEAIVDTDLINRNDIIVQNWMEDTFSAGTYCYIKPGFALHVVDDLASVLDNTLYFAGTATSSAVARGTAHGAYGSGLRVAKEVLGA